MHTPELPLWQRITTAILLVAAAWFVHESEILVRTVGSSAVRLSAGVAALSVVLGMKLRPGMWPGRLRRAGFSMPAALVAAAIGAVAVAISGRGGLGGNLWAADRGGILGVLVGGAGLSVIVGQSRFYRSWRWLLLAAFGGALPWVFSLVKLRMVEPAAVSLDGRMLAGSTIFFVVSYVLTLLVTDEFAFRRLLVGRGESGFGMILGGAFIYGVWFTFLPAGPGGSFAAFMTGVSTGLVAGSLYVLSQSLLVAAVFSGTALGGITATLQALRVGGTHDEHLQAFSTCASAAIFAVAVVLGLVVLKKVGIGTIGEYSVGEDAAGS